jgi:hypothetical protein
MASKAKRGSRWPRGYDALFPRGRCSWALGAGRSSGRVNIGAGRGQEALEPACLHIPSAPLGWLPGTTFSGLAIGSWQKHRTVGAYDPRAAPLFHDQLLAARKDIWRLNDLPHLVSKPCRAS